MKSEKPTTVEPPNKGHFGDNVKSNNLSFIDRLSFLDGSMKLDLCTHNFS